ncbi:MAG TPA: alkaline phosphatase D family protein [Chitinophagaceae bacterium]
MRLVCLFSAFYFSIACMAQRTTIAQTVVSGPMIGHVELRTATIWMQFSVDVKEANVIYAEKGTSFEKAQRSYFRFDFPAGALYHGESNALFNTARSVLINLQPGKTYEYRIYVNRNKQAVASGAVTTQPLWQHREPAPDFSFLTGSCAYFNEPVYDRPGKPYGSDSIIFDAMGKEKADFMLWLGDNWYYREVDFYSSYGLYYRASRDRATKVIQPLLKAMPQYAIWDDHDYGWNNSDRSFPLKDASRDIFTRYWCNPSYGQDNEGIYTKFTWKDIDVFMLDSRWFRNNDLTKDSLDNAANPDKRMFGKKQMDWLKDALLESKYNYNISFRFIATGSQVLNPVSAEDCLKNYPVEYTELISFIRENGINGVVFITGDRHHSEVIGLPQEGFYTLYDVTSSSFTAGISATRGAEKNNPFRVAKEIPQHNYTRISVSGDKKERRLKVEFLDIKGQKVGEWGVALKELVSK